MTSGASAYGTFLVWNGSKVLEISGISGPSQSRDTIDLTSHDSTDSYREYVAGIIDAGEISIDGNFIKGDTKGQIAFHTDMQAGTKRSCFVVMPMAVGGAWSFEAIASGFDTPFPFDSKIGVSGTLKITGKPTLLTTQSAGMTGLTGHEYDGAVEGAELDITPTVAAGTYAYACEVTDSDQDGVKLTVTAASHTIYVNGVEHTSGVEGDTISLGDTGSTTIINIIAYETAKAPRLYTLLVTRPAAA